MSHIYNVIPINYLIKEFQLIFQLVELLVSKAETNGFPS